jgi:hypothetical protein
MKGFRMSIDTTPAPSPATFAEFLALEEHQSELYRASDTLGDAGIYFPATGDEFAEAFCADTSDDLLEGVRDLAVQMEWIAKFLMNLTEEYDRLIGDKPPCGINSGVTFVAMTPADEASIRGEPA